MPKISRETVIENINRDLVAAKEAAEQAQIFAVECAKNNSISGSGERAAAEDESARWQGTVSKLVMLKKCVEAGSENPERVSLGALTELDMDGDEFVAIISDINCRLSLSDATVVTPQSPLGRVLMGHGQGETVEYQMGNMMMRARIKSVY